VRAFGSIEAVVSNPKSLHRLAVHNVRFDDLLNIGGRHLPIPHAVGIHDYGRSMLALIQASGHVGAHALPEPAQCELLLKEILQLGLALGITAAPRMTCFALVAADEKVLLELGHELNVQDFGLDID